ncbi:MAG TPA: tRNA (adenosine(37)-N6)-threonylcarbamoyltransferase complex dimerization subunit type 1 TsaB [Patescibacteria group bacterium]|nr:tRNA (adenosine(37)-N6)-threonylcarbamoyltransferase complex dimerization subunit type 1 TsaB [Patescibacteria group bacterium]
MLILTIRTDKPEAEIGLFKGEKELKYEKWQAHRELAETIHNKIRELLSLQGATLQDLGGIVVFKGPGSFTGLRIGITVANALADALKIPVVSTQGKDWIQTALVKVKNGDNEIIALPEYGSEPHITQQKH